ncbi:MAG: SGNH/GDSL hydrolase family protein [Clostridia bacterium]|nr:SGNH/GDSL hydrolase family protein [Clostridia bacterium]
MKILCLGDSLTEGDYGLYGKHGIANVQKESYPYFLSLLTDAQVINGGRCGARASSELRYYKTELREHHDFSSVDAVMIMLGSNGGLTAFSDSDENAAYGELVDLVRADCPAARVYLCPPPHITRGITPEAMLQANVVSEARTFVRRFASQRGLPVIPTDRIPEFTDENEFIYQPNDGCHFSKKGYMVLAAFIAAHIGAPEG